MRRLLFLWILFSVISNAFAQEVQFPPSLLAAGGSMVEKDNLHVSKWRIGRVNVLYLNNQQKSGLIISSASESLEPIWNVSIYPNPVTQYLNVEFELEHPKSIGIELFDISGRKVLVRKKQLIYPRELVRLDLSEYTSAMYLVHIISEDKALNEVFKISKQ